MELIFCDLDIKLEMYNVPIEFRRKLEVKFRDCKFIYESNQENFKKTDVTIYWGNRLPVDFIDKFPNLKWIHFGSVGIDRFKRVRKSKKNKILVTNSQNSVTKGMYAHTLFQIFYLLRQGYLIEKMSRSNNLTRDYYDLNFKKVLNINQLKALIVGYGNVGSAIGSTLTQMGAKVTGIGTKEKISNKGIKIFTIEKLKELVKHHNIVISLLPYEEELIGVFKKEVFDNMPKNSYFINNGRSSHVIEKDLLQALDNNIAGAAIDVYEIKSDLSHANLFNKENLFITPHIAAVDPSYWQMQIPLFEYNLECFLKNKIFEMKNICNSNS